MGGSALKRQITRMLQLISSMLITLPFIPKIMHVTLFIYLLLKGVLQ